jgi:nicotinate-nucleotide adenylyltransferase
MKIGLFGGSFDPVHLGHVYLVQEVKKKFLLDKVIIFPARVSPFKLKSPPKSSGKERMEMLRLAFIAEEGVEFSSCELERAGPSYTIDTIREIKKNHSQDELYLLLSQEAKERFSEWREREEIEKNCRVIFGPKKEGLSSTHVRDALKRGETCKDFLSPKVLDYIKQKELYS